MAPSSTGSWWLWAGCAATGAYTIYALWPKPRRGADETDFAGFLADPSRMAAPGAHSAAPRDETGFDSFLRSQPAPQAADPTGFDTFLRVQPSAAGGAQSGGAAAAQRQAEQVPLDRAGVAVLYGTEYGFSKEIAEKLCAQLKAGDAFWPRLVNVADHPEGYDLAAEQAVLMVCSTQGDGVPPTEARDFCDWLFAGKAGQLPSLRYSVLALGDKSYPHFCRCGKQLDAALTAAGAKEVVPRVDVDKEDWAAVDGWLQAVEAALPGLGLRSLAETGGAAAAAGPTAPSGAAAKRHSKARPYFARVRALQGLCVVEDKRSDKETVRVELDLGDSGLTYAPGDALGVYPTNCSQAVSELLDALGVIGDEPVTVPSWHYQEPAGHSTLMQGAPLPSMPLRAALERCYDLRSPKGEPLLKALLAAMPAAEAGAAVAVDANGATNGKGASHGMNKKKGAAANGNGAAASGAAMNGAAANGGAANGHGSGFGDAARQACELRRLLGDKQALEAYLTPRHVIDVLREFDAAQLAHEQLLPALRQLQPRLYSISSSPLEDPAGVQATIAVVRYHSLGADRMGVCSTFVAERSQVGDFAPVYISKNPDFRLPEHPSTPIIMVGPGTGLAPFRAFIVHRLIEAGADPALVGGHVAAAAAAEEQQHERAEKGPGAGKANGHAGGDGLQQKGHSSTKQQRDGRGWGFGPMVLYFGCRRRNQDYLYGADLQRWAAAGAIELHTAFSREPGRPKVYVQQRLEETADRVWALLQEGAHFYVCGDANSMAGAVEEALLRIIAARLPADALGGAGGGAGQAEARARAARAYLQRLADEHRYERDVWFA